MQHYSVTLALKFVTRVQKSARNMLKTEWTIVGAAQKRVVNVQKNAVPWQALMHKLISSWNLQELS
jgi:hypothetical protein